MKRSNEIVTDPKRPNLNGVSRFINHFVNSGMCTEALVSEEDECNLCI